MIGARLKQARLLKGMTQRELAESLGEAGYSITAAAISKYELEKSYPTAQFMLLASAALDVPGTYLLHQPSHTVEWLEFRCRKRLSQAERQRIKAYASDIAELQIELRELLYPDSRCELPSVPVATLEDAENAAEQLRCHWDVGDRPLDNLVQTSEDRDIVVVGWDDCTGLFDGLSGRCGDQPVAVVNSRFPLDRRRLTLAHEIGHLVMDTGFGANLDEEALAFRFAAALLVPAKHAYKELGKRSRHLDWGELRILKRKYGISMAAWVRRAYDLNIITYSHYKTMNIQYKRRGWHKEEPVKYIGDEEPIQLKQMAQRAIAEGLVAPDRFEHLNLAISYPDSDIMPRGEYPSATDLLAMGEGERERWISQMFEWADGIDFEIFEAFGEEEF